VLARKKKPEVTYNWHPNFRVVAALPDIKQVRTGFLVNFVAIFLAMVALGFLLYIEVNIYKVNVESGRFESQIADKENENTKDVAFSTQFYTQSKGLQFVAGFLNQDIPPLDLLDVLAAARPTNILFQSISIDSPVSDSSGNTKKGEGQHVTVSGTLTGEAQDLTALDVLTQKLLAAPVLKSRVADPVRDCKVQSSREAPGIFSFTITIALKSAS
jgi:hypothetical protein